MYIDKSSKFCRLIPIFLRKGKLGAKQVASILFDSIVRLFGVPTSLLHEKDVHFTE